MNRRRQLLLGLGGLALTGGVRAQPRATSGIRFASAARSRLPARSPPLPWCTASSANHGRQINKKGGMLGRPVEWILLDDQSKPDVARSLYERLITVDKVDRPRSVRHGNDPRHDADRAALQQLFIQGTNGLPHTAGYDMQFPASPIGPAPNKTVPPLLLDLLATSPTPPKTISVVTSKFPSGQFISAGMRDYAPTRGLKMPLYLEYEFGTRDFGPIASRIKEANADFLWVGSLGLESNQLLGALKAIDYVPTRHFHLFSAPGPLGSARRRQRARLQLLRGAPALPQRPGVQEVLPSGASEQRPRGSSTRPSTSRPR